MQRLNDSEREGLIAKLDIDGYVVLPHRLEKEHIDTLLAAIDRISDQTRGSDRRRSVKRANCVDTDPAFRKLMMCEPALQLAYDCFGPMFHLCQSNFVSRPNDGTGLSDFTSASPWHADGPRPGMFPSVNGAMGLHYLKFGYFLTDLTHGNGGSLQVVRGSHKRPELDGKMHGDFNIDDYQDDLVQFDCPAGTVVAFHQAQWHAAPPNESEIERKNAYVSYCPTWMRPLDRECLAADTSLDLPDEERWLLGEYRSPLRWWIPSSGDLQRMSRFARDGDEAVGEIRRYE